VPKEVIQNPRLGLDVAGMVLYESSYRNVTSFPQAVKGIFGSAPEIKKCSTARCRPAVGFDNPCIYRTKQTFFWLYCQRYCLMSIFVVL